MSNEPLLERLISSSSSFFFPAFSRHFINQRAMCFLGYRLALFCRPRGLQQAIAAITEWLEDLVRLGALYIKIPNIVYILQIYRARGQFYMS